MGQPKFRRTGHEGNSVSLRTCVHESPRSAAAFLLAALILAPVARAQSTAQGDSYLGAIRLNPGSDSAPGAIAEPAGASFSVDTTSYGRQADIFSPPDAGGVPEPNKCAAVRYGRTVWAWFHTERWVRTDLHVTASFPAVFALMPFRSPAHPALDPAAGVLHQLARHRHRVRAAAARGGPGLVRDPGRRAERRRRPGHGGAAPAAAFADRRKRQDHGEVRRGPESPSTCASRRRRARGSRSAACG